MDILENKSREEVFQEHFGISLPTDSVQDEIHSTTRSNSQKSLYFFSTAILGFDKIQQNPHLEVCSFIQRIPKSRKVCLIPRDCYKSTIGSKSLPLWILIQDSFQGLPGREHRILCASFSSENAKKHIKAIRHQMERNTFLQWVFPELSPDFTKTTWTDSNLLFPREGVYGEDTIEAAGVDTHLVSRHYTIQVKDDLEDEKAMQSPTVRAKVYDWYKSAEALFVDEQTAFDLLIGTRWGVDDLYSQIQKHEGDTYEFLTRPLHWRHDELVQDLATAVDSKTPPVYNMDPERFAPDPHKTYYFFPKLFPEDSCRRIRDKQGSFMYSMLYLNNPKDPSLAEFRERDLRYFVFDTQGNIVIHHPDGQLESVDFAHLYKVMFWDPALSEADKKKNARNAIVACGKDSDDRIFVFEAILERTDPTKLFGKVIGTHKRYDIQRCAIEDVAFQRVLKFPLYHAMKLLNHKFPVLEQRPVGDKDTRIRSLIPYTETHTIFVQRRLRDLIQEMLQFPLFPTKDGVDALAACIELFGNKQVMNSQQEWRRERNEARRLETRNTRTGY